MRFLLPILLLLSGAAMAQPRPACPLPPDTAALLAAPLPPLPRARAAVVKGRLTILAIGGGATTGQGATPEDSYPARLRAHLARLLPGVEIALETRPAAEASTRQRAAAVAAAVAELHPNLVLWATGTREAVRRANPARFAAALAQGIAAAHAAGADAVLVDPQFAPGWAAIPLLEEYRDTVQGAAELAEVPLFPRHALMEAWHETGVIDLAATGAARQQGAARALYDCLGAALAEFLVRGLR